MKSSHLIYSTQSSFSTDPPQEELFNVSYKYPGNAVETGSFFIDVRMQKNKVNISNIAFTVNIQIHDKSLNRFTQSFNTTKIKGVFVFVNQQISIETAENNSEWKVSMETDIIFLYSCHENDVSALSYLNYLSSCG